MISRQLLCTMDLGEEGEREGGREGGREGERERRRKGGREGGREGEGERWRERRRKGGREGGSMGIPWHLYSEDESTLYMHVFPYFWEYDTQVSQRLYLYMWYLLTHLHSCVWICVQVY